MSKSNIPTIAIDFDGTITKRSEYPKCGDIRPQAASFIRKIHDMGYRVILWTCRSNSYVNEALSLLRKENIYDLFDWDYLEDPNNFGEHGKIIATFYVDDRALINVDLDADNSWEYIQDYIISNFPIN